MPVPHYTGSCSFVGSIEIRKYECINFDFPLKIALALENPLHFHMKFRINCLNLYPPKKAAEILNP